MSSDQMINDLLKGSGYKVAPVPVRKKQYRHFFCKNCGLHVEGLYRSDKIYCDECGSERKDEIIREKAQENGSWF